jgi:hypothetical protein
MCVCEINLQDHRLTGFGAQNITLADLFHLGAGTLVTENVGAKLLVDEDKRPNVAR